VGLKGEKILLSGPASQVGLPLARALVADNELHGVARFGRPEQREALEALGVVCHARDLGRDDLAGLPQDFTLVLHFAVGKSGDFEADLAANAEGTGRPLSHCRRARAFVHCSTAGVYAHRGAQHPAREGDALGDNHRALLPTYSLSKIAGEAVARFAAREWGVPTLIARLSVPYGANGGWPWFHLALMRSGRAVPLHPERPNRFNPIHEDDLLAQLPRLVAAAAVPAAIVNWGGEPASIEEWCGLMAELTGLEARFETSERTVAPLPVDLARMHALIGPARVGWREGIRRMLEARAPELLR
jgi:nucleoside-diphosphate-sugar epimerase